jgi:ankyrin repeat protein
MFCESGCREFDSFDLDQKRWAKFLLSPYGVMENWIYILERTTDLYWLVSACLMDGVRLYDSHAEYLIKYINKSAVDAVINRDLQYIKLLVKYNHPQLRDVDADNNSLLHLACKNCDKKTVSLLLQKLNEFAYPAANNGGLSPLHYFCNATNEMDWIGIVCEMVATFGKGILELTDRHNDTILHYACYGNDIKLISKLLKLGANPDAKNKNGHTPLYIVCFTLSNGHCRVTNAQELLKRGASISSFPYILHRLCDNSRTDLVKLLLEHGADKEMVDDKGNKPIYYAVENNDMDIVRLFF